MTKGDTLKKEIKKKHISESTRRIQEGKRKIQRQPEMSIDRRRNRWGGGGGRIIRNDLTAPNEKRGKNSGTNTRKIMRKEFTLPWGKPLK